jgi:hypothetical protein
MRTEKKLRQKLFLGRVGQNLEQKNGCIGMEDGRVDKKVKSL